MPPPSRRLWLSIGAGVLAMIAIGMVGAVAVRCGGGDEPDGLDRGRLLTLAPAGANRVQGMNWFGLRRTELGRELLRSMPWLAAGAITEKACDLELADQVDWMVQLHDPSVSFGGVSVIGTAIDSDRAEDCLRKVAHEQGEDLTIDKAGKLRAYRSRGPALWVAWLDPNTVVMGPMWGQERGREELEKVVARTEPAPENGELARAVERVDTGATFWVAMVRPSRDGSRNRDPDDPDYDYDRDYDYGFGEIETWFDRDLSGLLGARPESVYLSLDVRPGVIEVRGGAHYTSEAKAKRVRERLAVTIERNAAAGGIEIPDLGQLDPVLRADIERRLREGSTHARALGTALWKSAVADVDGETVTLRAEIRGAELDALREARSPGAIIAEINQWLPRELRPGW